MTDTLASRASRASRAATLIVACSIVAPLGVRPLAAQSSLVATSPKLFEYHSPFWLNLHHFLYERARGLGGYDKGRAIVAAAVADTAGEGTLSPADKGALTAALAYYGAHLAPHEALERDMVILKNALGDRENAPTLAGAAIDDSLRLVLEAVAPAYRRVWWPRHDAANRRWIAQAMPLVARYGSAMVQRLTRDFDIPWSSFLIRVDVSGYSNWAGAYTTIYPDRITVASFDSTYLGPPALETLFHESLHTLGDSVLAALSTAARRRGKQIPRDFPHAMIFYTAGDAARRVLPDYQPVGERLGIWNRGAFPAYLPILQSSWQPFLDGQTSFAEAIDRMVAALP